MSESQVPYNFVKDDEMAQPKKQADDGPSFSTTEDYVRLSEPPVELRSSNAERRFPSAAGAQNSPGLLNEWVKPNQLVIGQTRNSSVTTGLNRHHQQPGVREDYNQQDSGLSRFALVNFARPKPSNLSQILSNFPSENSKKEEEDRTIRYAASVNPDFLSRVVQEIRANSHLYEKPCMIVREREHGDGHAHAKCEIILFAWGGECLVRQACVICMELIDLYQGYRLKCKDFICHPCLFKLFEYAITFESLYPPRCGGEEITLDWLFMNRFDGTFEGRDLMFRYREKSEEFLAADRTYCAIPSCSAFIKQNLIMPLKFAQCGVCGSFTCTICKNAMGSEECCVESVFEAEAKKSGWKKCFKCKTWIEKVEGTCDQMVCSVCESPFCYICGNGSKNCTCDGPPRFSIEAPEAVSPQNANNRLTGHVRSSYQITEDQWQSTSNVPWESPPKLQEDTNKTVYGNPAATNYEKRRMQRDRAILYDSKAAQARNRTARFAAEQLLSAQERKTVTQSVQRSTQSHISSGSTIPTEEPYPSGTQPLAEDDQPITTFTDLQDPSGTPPSSTSQLHNTPRKPSPYQPTAIQTADSDDEYSLHPVEEPNAPLSRPVITKLNTNNPSPIPTPDFDPFSALIDSPPSLNHVWIPLTPTKRDQAAAQNIPAIATPRVRAAGTHLLISVPLYFVGSFLVAAVAWFIIVLILGGMVFRENLVRLFWGI